MYRSERCCHFFHHVRIRDAGLLRAPEVIVALPEVLGDALGVVVKSTSPRASAAPVANGWDNYRAGRNVDGHDGARVEKRLRSAAVGDAGR